MKAWLKRKLYVYKRLKLIRIAQYDCITERYSSKTCALRGVLRFERVNNIEANVFDSYHTMLISGSGCHEEFFRAVKLLSDKKEK